MKLVTIVICAGLIAAGVGCGDDDSNESSAATTATTATTVSSTTTASAAEAKPAAVGKTVKKISSDYGNVIADTKGEALYLFTKETGSKSKCYGRCAIAWPPLLTKGEPRAGKGITASKLGTTKRKDGKLQVTYNGHPLYYYKDDSPGNILCQDVPEFGGIWYVVKPSGVAVT